MSADASFSHPHGATPVLQVGAALGQAKRALLLIHGRGASAEDILGLTQEFTLPADLIAIAPQASGSVWYPQRFIAPLEMNEPYLSSALRRMTELVNSLGKNGIPTEKVILGGFSQGACLATEFVLRNPRRWGGLLAFSGGYIGPMGVERVPVGSLENTPALLGCSDIDPHIPLPRVEETAHLLAATGAQVNKRIYPGMGHTINLDEIEQAQAMLSTL